MVVIPFVVVDPGASLGITLRDVDVIVTSECIHPYILCILPNDINNLQIPIGIF